MNADAPEQDGQAARRLTIGPGWPWSAAFAGLFILLVLVPGHHAPASGLDGFVAGVAILYVLGLSLVASRLVRGLVLRLGGNRDPIVLLGRGADPITSSEVRARWRLGALGAATATSLGAALVAAQLTTVAAQSTYGHAVAVFALGANLALGAAIVVPAPGFAGWALLLAVVDGARVAPDLRVVRAARLARAVGTPALVAGGIAAAQLRDPMLMVLAFLLAILTWTRSEGEAGQDATVRFLATHRAGDVARPIVSRAAPDEPLDDLLARLGSRRTVTLVEDAGGVRGAIGPRQLAARGHAPGSRRRCGDVMLPLAVLRPVSASAPAAEVQPLVAGHGFALVWGPDGLDHVEFADLGRQVRIWLGLVERTRGGAGRFIARPGPRPGDRHDDRA